MNQIDLSGRVAIITGGAQGIGLAIATRFTRSGAAVVLWDVDGDLLARSADGLRAGGANVATAIIDVTDADAVAREAEATNAAHGAIDILVTSAGIAGPTVPVADYDLNAWRRVIDIDLNGVFYCCRAVSPFMVARGYGRIVNIASIAGKEGNPNAAAYSAAKAGSSP